MRCPNCNYDLSPKRTTENQPQRWQMDLVFLSRYSEPIWGSPLRRGIDLATEDGNLRFLIEKGFAKQVRDEGFIATAHGQREAKKIKSQFGYK